MLQIVLRRWGVGPKAVARLRGTHSMQRTAQRSQLKSGVRGLVPRTQLSATMNEQLVSGQDGPLSSLAHTCEALKAANARPSPLETMANKLVQAIEDGNRDTFQALIADCDDVNAFDRFGSLPLCTAAWEGHADIVEALLKHGADANKLTAHGDSALFNAALSEYPGIVKLLLDFGADPNVDLGNKSVMSAAAMVGDVGMVKLLLKHHAVADCAKPGWTYPIVVAACNGNMELVDVLIDAKVNLNVKDEHGWTALDYAVLNKRADLVDALKAAGATDMGQHRPYLRVVDVPMWHEEVAGQHFSNLVDASSEESEVQRLQAELEATRAQLAERDALIQQVLRQQQ